MAGKSPLLRMESVTRTFGGLTALSGVSFEVPEGMLLGVLGPNGAGKTTCFNVITGVFPAMRGRIWLGDTEITRLPPHRICRLGIGRTWQAGRPFEDLSVLENAMLGYHFGSSRKPDARAAAEAAWDALELVGMKAQAQRASRELNVFERKMLELARCVAAQPQLLLLDEILAGLNPGDLQFSLSAIRRIHRERRISIIWIEHIVRVLMESAESILVLHHGERLAQGTPDEIKRDPRVIEAYLGG